MSALFTDRPQNVHEIGAINDEFKEILFSFVSKVQQISNLSGKHRYIFYIKLSLFSIQINCFNGCTIQQGST